MQRRHLILVTGLGLALVGGRTAFAERLGGAYRGPEDSKATAKDTSDTGTSDSGSAGPEGGTRSGDSGGSSGGVSGGSGDGGDSGGGGGGGGSGGDGGSGGGGGSGGDGGSGSGGEGGSSSGGGEVGGGNNGTGTAKSGGSAGTSSSGAASGTGVGGKKGVDPQQIELQVVAWYFEHNRERLMKRVLDARNRRIRPSSGSMSAALSVVPRETRVRSNVTVDDREKIVDVLKKNTLAQEDVVRDAAVIALGKVGTPDAVDQLRDRLAKESKTDIRQDILLALGIARTPDAIEALAAVVRDSNAGNLHTFALLGLGVTQNAEKAGPVLLDYFRENVRKPRNESALAAAALSLGALRYEEAESALIAGAKAKGSEIGRVYMAHAIGRIGSEEGRKALVTLTGDKNDEVVRAALLALGGYAESDVLKTLTGNDGLGNSNPLTGGLAAISAGRVLSKIPASEWKKVPDALRDAAAEWNKSAILSQYANLALALFEGGIDVEARKRYLEVLGDKSKASTNKDVAASIEMAIGVAGVRGFESSLEAIAGSASVDPRMSGYAAFALGMTSRTPADAQTLQRLYRESDKVDVQRGAVLGLGLAGDRRDVPFLIEVIEKTDRTKQGADYTRGAAVVALGTIRDGDSVSKLLSLLSNTDPWVRGYAIAALGYLADKDPSPVLPTLFEHNNFRAEFPSLKVAMRTL